MKLLALEFWLFCFFLGLLYGVVGCGSDGLHIDGAVSTGTHLKWGAEVFKCEENPYPVAPPVNVMEGQLEALGRYFQDYCKDDNCEGVLSKIKAIVLASSWPLQAGPCLYPGWKVAGCWLSWEGIIWIGAPDTPEPWASGVLVHEAMHVFEDRLRLEGGRDISPAGHADNDHSEPYWKDVLQIARDGEATLTGSTGEGE